MIRIGTLRGLVLMCLVTLGGGSAWAGDILVQQPWARASIGAAKAGAAYFTVVNQGALVDRLVAVESQVADRTELHGHLMEQGVMKMRPVEAIEVAPGEPAVLKPGGLHVMFMGLRAPLAEGSRFPLTLVFARAGRIEIEVMVMAPTAMGHGHGSGS